MLKIEHFEVTGLEHAIRGMRNPMNSWDQSDSRYYCDDEICFDTPRYNIGKNDLGLMMKLRNAGTDHRKFMRMIIVYFDITAPLYWWKEFDTYKVGTVANSCSTMHKIADKEFEWCDFSTEHLRRVSDSKLGTICPTLLMDATINALNESRTNYLRSNSKEDWWQMIQLLPSSYNQKRTVMLNYEVLQNMYHNRKNHKLDEWHTLCAWIANLSYSNLITDNDEK